MFRYYNNLFLYFFFSIQTLKPSMNAVRNAIDKSLAERDQNVDKFCSALDKDIADLGKQVKQVKQEAQVTMFLTETFCLCQKVYMGL